MNTHNAFDLVEQSYNETIYGNFEVAQLACNVCFLYSNTHQPQYLPKIIS